MSTIGFLLKSKKKMEKENTKIVKVRGYNITSHAQNKIVNPSRNLKKKYVVSDLYSKPLGYSHFEYDKKKGPSYRRIGNYCVMGINSYFKNVTTAWRLGEDKAKKMGLIKRGNKYVKKSK